MAGESCILNVGKQGVNDSDKIRLDSFIWESSKPTKGTIVISSGIATSWRAYEEFAESLFHVAEHYRVVAFSMRGHGDSNGCFSPALAPVDLEGVVAEQKPPIGIFGHSVGATFAAQTASKNSLVAGLYLACPFLGPTGITFGRRLALTAMRAVSLVPGPAFVADALLHYTGASQWFSWYSRRPLRDLGSLATVQPSKASCATAYAVSDADESLGANHLDHYEALRDKLNELYPQASEHSAHIAGLNHCLNPVPRDYYPFCKTEGNKKRKHIIESVAGFFQQALNGEHTK
ncbi:alpha/beta fold hydrolase [Candidatus Woesearchaeota archaeon]|nr:alpha/beta fold hydrolase [Candidatus Woesearchaeota archaeon]